MSAPAFELGALESVSCPCPACVARGGGTIHALVVAKVSALWKQARAGLAFTPGAPVEPPPFSHAGAIATVWTWSGLTWLDGHQPPYPFENCGADGWRWAGRSVGDCIPCGRPVTLVRVGTSYLCAACRAYIPASEAHPRG